MRRRLYFLLLAVAAGIALGWWGSHRSTPETVPQAAAPGRKHLSPPPPEPVQPPPASIEPLVLAPTPFTPPPVVVPGARPAVRIQDGKTIDFSSGKPVVKESGEEKAIIDAAVKEMDEAAKNVRFGPTPPATGEKRQPAVPASGPSGG
jgi:hypothetical protein